jgi:hypothetical protein
MYHWAKIIMLNDAADTFNTAIKSHLMQGWSHLFAATMLHHPFQQLCLTTFATAPNTKISQRNDLHEYL